MLNFPVLYRFLHAALFEDWVLKFICLFMAIVLWFYIDAELTDQREFTVRVRPTDIALPANVELAPNQPLPSFVVKVHGPRRRLQFLQAESIGFRRKILDKAQPGRYVLNMQSNDVEADRFDVLSVMPKDNKEPVIELQPAGNRQDEVIRRLSLDVQALTIPGATLTTTPRTVEVEAVGEARDMSAQDVISGITLYVKWPPEWDRPKDSATVLGPVSTQVQSIASPRITIRGVNGGPLPSVEVRGAWAEKPPGKLP